MARHKPKDINILFTSVGRRVELLREFHRAYKNLNLSGHIVATDIDPLAPALQIADRPYLVPRLNASTYIPTLLEICRREAIDLIFPLIDPDIPVLAANKSILEAAGANVIVVSRNAVELTRDKWLTTQFFQRLGLPTPQSWLPDELDPDTAEYPLFIKPRSGSAAKHTFRVNNALELRFFMNYVPDPIIQECLPGAEITNDVICDLDGKLLGVASRKRIEVRWGEVAKGITIYDPDITNACARIAEALPAVGPITVQCMLKNGNAYFTEINARMGGGLPLGIAAGVDAPRWLLAQAAGIRQEIPSLGDYRIGLSITRCDDSFFLSQEDVSNMENHRLDVPVFDLAA